MTMMCSGSSHPVCSGYESRRLTTVALVAAFAISAILKLSVLNVGSPFITIDDKTAFEGGFLVWFGNAPPQRMYLESWIYGITCLAVYLFKLTMGMVSGEIGPNLMAEAYRDFLTSPDLYVVCYRFLTLLIDLATACVVWRIAVLTLGQRWRGGAAAAVAILYLLSYNTLWSAVVARPDSVLAFLCSAGLLFYLKSSHGADRSYLLACAITLGLAAGQKLHGAFVAIFLCFDLLRMHGLAAGARKGLLLASVSFLFFLLAAGSPLFDPLMYLKLRFANYADDYSPWLVWGDQFRTMLRGSGWLTLPFVILGAWFAFARREGQDDQRLRTIFIVALGWLLLFSSIRQLRAYWMLPALPVFYIAAVYGIVRLRSVPSKTLVIAALLLLMSTQMLSQVRELRTTPYGDLREWVTHEIGNRPFYVLGYDSLLLPKNTRCLDRTRRVLERGMAQDRVDGIPFAMRHVKNWEERSSWKLMDMLDFTHEPGFEFYDYYSAPPKQLATAMDLSDIEFILLQEGFDLSLAPEFGDRLGLDYELVTKKVGAGGGGRGMTFEIYARK